MAKQLINVTNLSKAVGDRRLLSDITFTITSQSLVSIIGPNGAGKSTLVKIILGLDHQYTGTVHVADKSHIQYIAQQTANDEYQLPLSVHEYLSIGQTLLYTKQSKRHDFGKALEHVGVASGKLSQPVSSLSGGEQQRVAIARALLSEPSLLILDEPLAAVDYASRAGLYELIRHLQRDHHMTVLLVSHDVESVLPISDKVLCLNQTLHTDCHPNDFSPSASRSLMHHHC